MIMKKNKLCKNYDNDKLYIVCFKSKKKRKKKAKPFKNPNSSLFQNKSSGISINSKYHILP